MNPKNKKFLLAMIDKFPVSVTTLDDTVMYHIMLPDNRALSICADITIMDSVQTIIIIPFTLAMICWKMPQSTHPKNKSIPSQKTFYTLCVHAAQK